MPQLDFYLEEQDKIALMTFIFSEGGYIIPLINYTQPSFTTIRSIEDYLPFVNQSLSFFIGHDSYFIYPLTWGSLEKQGTEYFYLRQRIGGPTLDFYSPGFINKTGVHFIGQGNISYYPSFQNSEEGTNLQPPEELRLLYKKLCIRIKKSVAIKLDKRTYWVGENAIVSLRNGVKLMNVSDKTLEEFLVFTQAHS